MNKEIRLDKLLADCDIGTRSQVKNLIKSGKITVNGMVCKDAGRKVCTSDIVFFEQKQLLLEALSYYMLNKPQNCVSATRDNLSETVIELLAGVNTKGLFPVGRLDKDTEGLLLITNDGQLSHNLLSPKKHVAKTYLAVLDAALSMEDIAEIENGIDIGDEKPCLPAKIEKGSTDCTYEITITEGRFHQVKRMFAKRGKEVLFLKRLSMGALKLDASLAPGEYRKLTETEIKQLKERTNA